MNDKCITMFNYNGDNHPGTMFTVNPKDPKDPSRSKTSQQYKDESDINNIVNQYLKNGVLPDDVISARQAVYGDATGLDYLNAQNLIATATDAFNTLDAKTRERFGNNPANLLDFISDPQNTEEAIALNLLPDDIASAYKEKKNKAEAAAKAALDAAAAAEAAKAAKPAAEAAKAAKPAA